MIADASIAWVDLAPDQPRWPKEPPGRTELFETKALIVGMGAIGNLIGERLAAFEIEVTGVTRSGRNATLTPDQWRARLGEFDWIVLAAPSTDATKIRALATASSWS